LYLPRGHANSVAKSNFGHLRQSSAVVRHKSESYDLQSLLAIRNLSVLQMYENMNNDKSYVVSLIA